MSLTKKDGVGALPVRHARPSAPKAVRVLVLRQERFHQGPKLVADPKASTGTREALGPGLGAPLDCFGCLHLSQRYHKISYSDRPLANALTGAQVVVDVANAPSWEDAAVLDFFETSGRNLLAAEGAAGVGHHVALSVVGTNRLLASGYFRAKLAQENLIKASAIPYTIVRATQFFEFLGGIAQFSTVGQTVHLPPALASPGNRTAGCAREARCEIVRNAGHSRPLDFEIKSHYSNQIARLDGARPAP